MKNRNLTQRKLLMVSILLFTFPVFAGNIRNKQPDAEQRCEEARELKLAPERERMIEKCVATKKDVVYCENYYRDYGTGGSGAGRKYRKRKYNDIPDCQIANKNAQRNRTANEGVIRGRDADNVTTRDTVSGSSSRNLNEGNSGREGSAPSSR